MAKEFDQIIITVERQRDGKIAEIECDVKDESITCSDDDELTPDPEGDISLPFYPVSGSVVTDHEEKVDISGEYTDDPSTIDVSDGWEIIDIHEVYDNDGRDDSDEDKDNENNEDEGV